MAKKYECTIVLTETGECLKVDTLLRVEAIIELAKSRMDEANREWFAKVIATDERFLRDRLQ